MFVLVREVDTVHAYHVVADSTVAVAALAVDPRASVAWRVARQALFESMISIRKK